MSSDSHRRPTTIGSEVRVMSDGGELLGFIGETREGPHEGLNFYARPAHDKNLHLDIEWFPSRDQATAHLKASVEPG